MFSGTIGTRMRPDEAVALHVELHPVQVQAPLTHAALIVPVVQVVLYEASPKAASPYALKTRWRTHLASDILSCGRPQLLLPAPVGSSIDPEVSRMTMKYGATLDWACARGLGARRTIEVKK